MHEVLEEIEEGFWSRFYTDEDEIRRKLYAYITGQWIWPSKA